MDEVTRVLSAIERGDAGASAELLPLVYEELRRLAARKIADERPGQTLQPTALVHEAYLRLVAGNSAAKSWTSRRHFFGAAAEAMRRILIENARRKSQLKRGGQVHRVDVSPDELPGPMPDEQLLALHEALEHFEQRFPERAAVVKLRFFAGLTNDEAAAMLDLSPTTTQRHWTFARVWLFNQLKKQS